MSCSSKTYPMKRYNVLTNKETEEECRIKHRKHYEEFYRKDLDTALSYNT